MIEITLANKAVAMERTGARSSKFHDLIKKGLMVPPVHIGKSARFPLHEINAICAARVAGHTDEQIKNLVTELVTNRREIFKEWRAAITAAAA